MQENSHHDSRQPGRAALGGVLIGGALTAFVVLAAAAPRVAGLLVSSAAVAVPATLLAMAFGTPIALLIAKTDVPGRRTALVLVGTLLLLPLYVIASAWMAALGDQGGAPALLTGDGPAGGWLVGYSGAIFLHAVVATPWATLLAVAALRSVDPRLEEAALLDASARRVLGTVTLRGAAPALAAAGVLLAVLAAAEMTMTDLLQVRTFAEEVYTQAAAGELLDPTASGTWRLAVGVLTLGLVAAAATLTLVRRLRPSGMAPSRHPWRLALARPRVAAACLAIMVGLLTLLPVVALAYRAGGIVVPQETGPTRSWSLTKLVTSVGSAPWQHRRELIASTGLALTVATTATFAAAAIAWSLRGRRLAGDLGGVGLAMLLAVPGPVIGLVVIRLLNQPLDSPMALLGDLYGTWFAPWFAQMVRITPAIALLLWPAALAVPAEWIDAARIDGAGSFARWRWVAAPSMAPALGAAWLAAFALSLGELSATVLVVPPGTPPLSVRMLSLLHYGVEDRVAALGLVLVLGYLVIAAAVGRLLPLGRRAG
ncbi:putative 2-aminoethylphosphonate transport system permease protein PhnU [Botrimarina colliarenosi]|uniref:Putative 2-aminoethylphosphonate transport system permease protein PhnU n=1 Tax=Botrimarina colliarenosi TaxID=2528001 RepID=A0A5C6AAD7_9BACT|nr:ABC transporter permease subunit [Botrimarina colliarenosi]TWT96992.1 putative 2-aminoethylphosphonate transport system permease protein PhnU [Botrimarina colliarenosi]